MYLSFLWRNISMIAVWWNRTCLGCRWDAPAALPEACVGATRNVWTCSFSVQQSMVHQGFMCKAWCFRVELVARALFNPATAKLQYRIAVCWTALQFVRFTAQKSRSHDQSKDYSKYIVFFVSNFPHETNLASSFGLVTVFITMTFLFLIFFSTALILRFNIYLLIVSE